MTIAMVFLNWIGPEKSGAFQVLVIFAEEHPPTRNSESIGSIIRPSALFMTCAFLVCSLTVMHDSCLDKNGHRTLVLSGERNGQYALGSFWAGRRSDDCHAGHSNDRCTARHDRARR